MSKQTAVEWLTEMITNMIHEAHHSELADLFESAKAMEKERTHGAKWQAERMYSEEEVQLILSKLLTDIKNGNAGNSVEWFEQFKKK